MTGKEGRLLLRDAEKGGGGWVYQAARLETLEYTYYFYNGIYGLRNGVGTTLKEDYRM